MMSKNNKAVDELLPKKIKVNDPGRLRSFVRRVLAAEGLINIDYADLRTIFSRAKQLSYAAGFAWAKQRDGLSKGERVGLAVLRRLGGINHHYKSVVFNVTGGKDLSLHDVNDAAQRIYAACSCRAHIIFGAVINPKYQGKIRVDVVGAR